MVYPSDVVFYFIIIIISCCKGAKTENRSGSLKYLIANSWVEVC